MIVEEPLRKTSIDYTTPYRPWPLRLANTAGRAIERLGFRASLSQDSLRKAACGANKLDDFGEPDFTEPLDVLLRSLDEEAYLNPLGRLITRKRLIGVLGNRLRAKYLFDRYPEVLETDLPQLIVITGLQRTGTTLLHRLLSADPDTRSLLSWEALNPAPFLGARSRDGMPEPDWQRCQGPGDRRRKMGRLAERSLSYMAPDFFAIHPVESEAPEEDVLLLDFAFLSTVPEATLRVPTYSSWLEEQDQGPAYYYMKKLLKLLLWQRPAKRWVLKTPHHLEYLDTLISVFPDVKIIHSHRDPLTALASFCSMISHGRGVFSDWVDPREVGRDWRRKVQRMINRAMAVRDHEHPGRFCDVSYYDLVSDPMIEIQRIYRFLDLNLSPGAESNMKSLLKRYVKDRFGVHRYRLDYFDLDPAETKNMFSDYIERFEIEEEYDE